MRVYVLRYREEREEEGERERWRAERTSWPLTWNIARGLHPRCYAKGKMTGEHYNSTITPTIENQFTPNYTKKLIVQLKLTPPPLEN